MQSKARMTIRFESPAKPKLTTVPIVQPGESKEKLAIDNSETAIEPSFTTWNSPYQDDIHALEEIIRRSDTARNAEKTVRKPQPIPVPLPVLKDIVYDELTEERWSRTVPEIEIEEEPSAKWYQRQHEASNLSEEGPSWSRVFLSVAAAVATGALFGYMVLSLFTGEPLFPGKSDVDSGEQIPVLSTHEQSASPPTSAGSTKLPEKSSTSGSGSTDQTGNEPPASTTGQVSSDVYFMLQYGVFQNEDSMQAAVKQLEDLGLAYASDTTDGYRVFAGAARSRDEAELLAAQMPDTEVYIKPVGGDPLTVSSDALSEEGIEFLNESAKLTRMLAQYSGVGLQDKHPRKLGTQELSELQETHQRWLKTLTTADKWNGEAAKDGNSIVKALNSAIASMTEFNRKPSRYHLWSVQSGVMQALLADRHVRLVLQQAAEG
ncbi:SPOR domain-containing protein [Cohnella luojiensis]|uniref:SPOR domain-containing protein n=1 Tax=Cohnella luojiensis TaxID=652876 RepID=A0A4Y8M794_9BACL|nr:SPOR domain-containing protein [Cohnella luojiensis]TFE30695.1 SPOR domain-containing protein [Cohnella luojiensis]